LTYSIHKHTTFIIICENTRAKAHENKEHKNTKAKVQEHENKKFIHFAMAKQVNMKLIHFAMGKQVNMKLIHFAMGKQVNMKFINAKLGNKNQLLAPFGTLCYFLMPNLSLQPMSLTTMGFYCCVCLMLWRTLICVQLHKLH
jgi:hypothetical protein